MNYVATMRDPTTLRAAIAAWLRAEAMKEEIELAPDEMACVGHLAKLRSRLAGGLLEPGQLLEQEAAGLALMDEVLKELQQKAHRCSRCGALSESSFNCERCGAKFSQGLQV